MLHIAICDDSAKYISQVENYLINLNLKNLDYDIFYNGNDIIRELNQNNIYSIYFLDIEMKPVNGIQLAKVIRRITKDALIIFITSYSQYVFDVFEVVTFDFLLKPISFHRFKNVLAKAIDYIDLCNMAFCFSYRKNYYTVFYSDIIYFEKSARILFIHTTKQRYQCNMTFKELLKEIDNNTFVQIHSSCIVNLKYVKSINKEEVKLITGSLIYASRDKKQYLKDKHLEYVKRRLK